MTVNLSWFYRVWKGFQFEGKVHWHMIWQRMRQSICYRGNEKSNRWFNDSSECFITMKIAFPFVTEPYGKFKKEISLRNAFLCNFFRYFSLHEVKLNNFSHLKKLRWITSVVLLNLTDKLYVDVLTCNKRVFIVREPFNAFIVKVKCRRGLASVK